MNSRNLIHWLMVCFAVVPGISGHAQPKPDIIYIMADDMGYADLSCYGQKKYTTPNLDRLASQGVKLMNAYATAPVCTPTRASFMTGRYPARLPVGLYEPIAESHADSLVGLSPANSPSVAHYLKQAGYETLLVGKWHLGYQPEFNPLNNGFDYFFGFHAGFIDYVNHGHDLYENEKPVNREGYMTDLLTEKAIELIKQPHTKPYFLALMYNAPHWPWQAPGDSAYPPHVNPSSGGSLLTYYKMMKSLDASIGKFINVLDSLKRSTNTVVIFTSDNGGERYSDNGPYKGRKMTVWEGGIREPAFVRWPGHIKPGTTSNQVTITMDWTASILALAGVKPDPAYPPDGMDVLPILKGSKKPAERVLYWRLFQRANQKAVRDGKWKYIKDEKGEYLFDLSKDPYEHHNLKDQDPEIFNRLKAKLSSWEATVLPPVPLAAASKS